jgi:DNA modification methylase
MVARGVLVGARTSGVKCHEGDVSGIWWRLYNGDALAALALVEEGSIDCAVTSPPYYWLRDYGVPGQIGLEATVEEYVESVCSVMAQVQRVLKKEGTLFLNIGDTYYSGKGRSHGQDKKSKKRRFGLRAVDKSGGLDIGLQRKSIIGIPWRVAIRMCEQGWVLRSPIIWHRDKCLPEAVLDRPRRSYEYVMMFAKSRHYHFDRKLLVSKNIDEDVWTIPPRSQNNGKVDTAPFPDELVERCLAIGCPQGGVVLDPFAGSGTTMHVALRTGRPVIGIELHPQFCKYIISNL